MDTSTKTYQIDKHKQLIPLNGTMVNFTCFFEVKSTDKKPFNLTIVEQGEIKPKQYKLVEDGYINGQIESDGQLKSYFLVLKSQEPCECNVRIILKPKEFNVNNNEKSSPSTQSVQPPTQPVQPPTQPVPPYPSIHLKQQESYFQMKYIIGISVALIIIYIIYRYRKDIYKKFSFNDTLMPSLSNTSF